MPAVKLATALAPLPTVSVIMAVTLEEIAAGTLTMFAPSVSDQLAKDVLINRTVSALSNGIFVYCTQTWHLEVTDQY